MCSTSSLQVFKGDGTPYCNKTFQIYVKECTEVKINTDENGYAFIVGGDINLLDYHGDIIDTLTIDKIVRLRRCRSCDLDNWNREYPIYYGKLVSYGDDGLLYKLFNAIFWMQTSKGLLGTYCYYGPTYQEQYQTSCDEAIKYKKEFEDKYNKPIPSWMLDIYNNWL